MSAPLVVNTTDGTCWTRRTVTSSGIALYAPADVCQCPEFVMATYAELEAHGIAGSAYALPMPSGTEPQEDDRAKAPWGRDENGKPFLPMGAHWTDVPELVDREVAGIRGRVDQAQGGGWYVAPATEMGLAPGTVRTRVDGYQCTVGQFTNVGSADLELILRAHADLSWCLDMIAKFRARVAELQAERHTTNEALDDAVQALRARRSLTDAEAAVMWAAVDEATPGHIFRYEYERIVRAAFGAVGIPLAGADEDGTDESADKLTRLLAPTQVLREVPGVSPLPESVREQVAEVLDPEGEFYGYLHHPSTTPHDRPETGGAR